MKHLLILAFRSLLNRRLSALLTLLSIALSVALLLGVERIRHQTQDHFSRSVSGTDLIIGPRGSSVQVLLASVFRIGAMNNAVSGESFAYWSQRPEVAWSIPLSLGDSFRGHPVIGTTQAYFDHFRYGRGKALVIAEGEWGSGLDAMLIGHRAARDLNLKIGDQVVIAHGGGDESFVEHGDHPFTVTGVLEPTGTPVDQGLHVHIEAMDRLHQEFEAGGDISKMDPLARFMPDIDLDAHDGHDHSTHEGHDHGNHEGHEDHEGHEGHDHGQHDEGEKHEGHDHSAHEGHGHVDHSHDHDHSGLHHAHGHDHGHGAHGHGQGDHGHSHADHSHDHSHGAEAHSHGHDHGHGAHGHGQGDHGHDHGAHDHSSHAGHDHAAHSGHDHGDHSGCDHGDHFHPPAGSVSAFLIGLHDRRDALALQFEIQRYEEEALQAVMPGVTLLELWEIMGLVEKLLFGISIFVVAVGLSGMALSLLARMQERRREMAILRAIGVTPMQIFLLIQLEALLLCVGGLILGSLGLALGLKLLQPAVLNWSGLLLDSFSLGPQEFKFMFVVLLLGQVISLLPSILSTRSALHDGLSPKL